MAQSQQQQLVAQHRAMVEVGKKAVEASALTLAMNGIDANQFAGVMAEALLANPDIAKADSRALARAVRKCCQHAIIPDGDRGAIVMFGTDPVAMPMAQGLLQMATEDLEAEIRSGVIHEGDAVEVIEGVGPGVEPVVTVTSGIEMFTKRKRSNVVGAWCWIKLPFETTARLVIFTSDDIAGARAASRAQNGPWKTWFNRMAEKACIKSAIWRLRYLKAVREKGNRILKVISEDNAAEYGETHVTDIDFTEVGGGDPDLEVRTEQEETGPSAEEEAQAAEAERKKAEAKAKREEAARKKAEADARKAQAEAQQAAENEQATSATGSGEGEANPGEAPSGGGGFLPIANDDDDDPTNF